MTIDKAIDGPVSPDCEHLEEEVVGHTLSGLPMCLMLKKPIDKSWKHTSTRLFSLPTDHERNTSVFESSLPGVQSHLASSATEHSVLLPYSRKVT